MSSGLSGTAEDLVAWFPTDEALRAFIIDLGQAGPHMYLLMGTRQGYALLCFVEVSTVLQLLVRLYRDA